VNVELEKTFSFPSVLVGANTGPWINHYDVQIQMRVTTDVSSEYDIAYRRMKFWFQDIMHSAVLIHKDDIKLRSWRDTGMTCLDFPENPVDQLLGLMLMSKLTAIVEGRMEILRVSVCSPADDWVTYFCDQTDNLHWFEQPGWWRDPGPMCCTPENSHHKSGKVISLTRTQDWKQHDLDWVQTEDVSGNVAIIENFDRDV
jgi:hypothetical protein